MADFDIEEIVASPAFFSLKPEEIFLNAFKNCQWSNKEEKLVRVFYLYTKFGIPFSFEPKKGGFVLWKDITDKIENDQVKLARIKVCDDVVLQKCAGKQLQGNVYVTIAFDPLAPSCQNQLLTFSKSLIMDFEGKYVTARADSYENCIVKLSVYSTVALCKVPVETATRNSAEDKAIQLCSLQEGDFKNFFFALAANQQKFKT